MSVKIKIAELPAWIARQRPGDTTGAWFVISSTGTLIASGLDETNARLVAAAPQMLAFLASFWRWNNNPALPATETMLRRAQIELELGQ